MASPRFLSRLTMLLAAAMFGLTASPAAAAVKIIFYSKEFGTSFPHAFVGLQGTPDRGGQSIDMTYGFTAKRVTPAILMGAVKGEIQTRSQDAYVRKSDKHFTLTISDAEYDLVMGVIASWRDAPQPSYDLDTRNCIHFVAQVASVLGMRADTRRFMKKPRSYLEALTSTNREWLRTRNAILHRE